MRGLPALLFTAVVATIQQPDPVLLDGLQMAAVVHRPGGVRVWAGTGRLGPGEVLKDGHFFTADTMCAFRSDPERPERARSHGWRYRMSVMGVQANVVSVTVEWQRVAPETGETASRAVTLRRGEAITLDRLLPAAAAACDATAMDLEVRICGGTPDPCRTHGWE